MHPLEKVYWDQTKDGLQGGKKKVFTVGAYKRERKLNVKTNRKKKVGFSKTNERYYWNYQK